MSTVLLLSEPFSSLFSPINILEIETERPYTERSVTYWPDPMKGDHIDQKSGYWVAYLAETQIWDSWTADWLTDWPELPVINSSCL